MLDSAVSVLFRIGVSPSQTGFDVDDTAEIVISGSVEDTFEGIQWSKRAGVSRRVTCRTWGGLGRGSRLRFLRWGKFSQFLGWSALGIARLGCLDFGL